MNNTIRHDRDGGFTVMNRNQVLKEIDEQTIEELSCKYKMSISTFWMRLKEFQEEVQQQEEWAVIRVHPKWINGISHLLESKGIPHEIPGDFELIEKYESKL